ncbi:MAG TPA: endopeptidase La [Candidatus Babeliales bacterium]|nr:endopeptidase La [Candidatus Babeliales bacterium]
METKKIRKSTKKIMTDTIEELDITSATATTLDHDFLALLPLKNVVILPKSIIPIIVGRQRSINAVEYALKHNKNIFITAQKDSHVESPEGDDVFTLGTRSIVLQVMRMPNGSLKILAEGICRSQAININNEDDFIGTVCQDVPTTNTAHTTEIEALWRQLKSLYTSYTEFNDKAPADLTLGNKTPKDLDFLTDTIAVHIANLSLENRQSILESADLKERMTKLCTFLSNEIEILQTEQRIRGRMQSQIEKNQREYYLNEQMKAIHKELGRDDQSIELGQLKASAKKLGLPQEALQKVDKELKRLEQMPPLSSEAVVSRHYIDWILSLPWNKVRKDTISLERAEKILNEKHAGLTKAKERIIEFLAAKKFSKNLERSPIICLVGPPGVGKTSLAQSIANSLGRDFMRISLGGVKDESEIRGHRRTYIGALPGKIIQAMKKTNYLNPVILLDEIDKISRDLHGDPASALLEVLDPEQNKTFADHFLDLEYDLSKVMFIATANMTDGIPYPLYDRMEIIQLSGYTDEEKSSIATKFLIPKSLKEHDLTTRQCKIPQESVALIISEYTKEAGVRQLERIITKLMRKTIQLILNKNVASVTVDKVKIKEWLGNPPFKKTSLSNATEQIGLATGLAWTELGGDVLEIETTVIPGKGNVTLTGQLGEVMQESAQAAQSYIRTRAKELGLKHTFHQTKDIHIHLPEGATPKDGPSAGITICAALISALTQTPLLQKLAMTGEITLRGRVLSVGGLREKLLAAKQHGFTKVIVPHENFDDIQEILKETDLSALNIVYVKTMDEVIEAAFEKPPFCAPTKKPAKKKSTAKTKTA